MAKSVQLPDGSWFPLREGEDPRAALSEAAKLYPDAFAPARTEEAPQKGGSGLGDIARSFGLGAVGATGALASVFGADNAAARGLSEAGESLQAGMSSKRKAELQMQAERMKQAEASGSTWQEIKAGLLNVLEAPVQSAAQAVGSFVPMVATLPLAKVGLGARAIMAVRGAIGGAQGAGSVKQNVYEAVLRAETEEGKSPEQAQAAAVRAQEYVGANLDQIMLGTGLGVVAGSTGAEKILPGGVRAKAGAAQQALAKRLGERAATGLTTAAAEMPLEGIQGGQERLAANLALQRTGRDVGTFTGVAGQAAQEALTGGLGGGALGAALPDRTMSMAAAEERKKQQEAKATAAAQQRLAKEQQAAADEEAKKSPEYAMQVGQQYETLLADFKARKAALKTPGKDATPVEKAEYADAQKALKELNEQLKEIVPEYRRTAPIRAQAQEQARVAGMDPFDYMMEQTGAVPTYTPSKPGTLPEVDMEGIPGAASDQPTRAAEASQALANYAAERIALAQEQLINPTSMELVDYLAQDPVMAARIVETKTPMPGMSRSESTLLRNALNKTLTAQTKAQEEARQAQGMQGTAAGRQRISEVEAEEQAALEAQRAQTERDIAEARREQALGGEFAGLQRMGAPQAGSRGVFDETAPYSLGANLSDQFGLFGEEQAPPAGSAAVGQMQQKLTGDDVTFTAEEEKARNLRRVPGAEFKLRGRNEGTAPVTREELADRLNAVLSTYALSPEAVELLQRAEKALPQSGAEYFALLDQQLAKIESGAEGVPRKGRERTLDLQTFPPTPDQQARASATAPTEAGERQIKQSASAVPGEAASGLKTPIEQPEAEDRRTGVRGAADVTKRIADTTPTTLRGPSARAADLSLARELEEPLLRQEEAARDDTGQKSLFPEEQEKLGFIKGNRGAFQMFMKSKFVQNLRQQLRRDEEIAKRAQAIPALEKRANALVAEIEDILKQYADYRSADEVIKANKDVAKAKRDMAEIRSAAGKATVDRMVLAGAIEDLKTARKQVIEQGYQEGGVQELLANIDAVNEQLQDAQTDMALLDSALSVLDGQMQSFAAVQKITALLDKAPSVERVEQAKQEFAAVRAELDVLQKENTELQNRLKKDAADKRRADEAVKDAERKTAVAAGRVKPAEQALNNLPLYDKATQYPALTEAQLLAREKGGTLPDLTAGEKIAIGGDPARVLGGYRARITALEKTIRQSQDKSKAALGRDVVEPKQKLRDALAKAYKQAKSAAERDTIGPKLDVAEAELARAQAELNSTDVIWVGMKSQIKQLADVIAREEWLSGMISEGRIELEAPSAAKVRAKPTEAEREQASARRVEDASVRTTAAATSGDPLTRSEAIKARQPQKTQFEGKGVPGGTAKEISMTPAERLSAMQARALERLKKGDVLLSRGAPVEGLTGAELRTELDKAVGDEKAFGNKVSVFDTVQDFLDANKSYDGNIPFDAKGFVDPDTGRAYLFAENIAKGEGLGILLHEVGVHLGFRNFFNAAQFNAIAKTVRNWANAPTNTLEGRIGRAAAKRAKDAGTSSAQMDDELIAYAVEEAVKAGVEPAGVKSGSAVANWLRTVVNAFNKALETLGLAPEKLKVGDLVNMAYGAAQLEIKGTWHGTDAAFKAFDTAYAGKGEGAFDLRFESEKSLGAGPYATPDKEYAEYYQHAVPFGKAANESGYGKQTYQDYRAFDDMFIRTPNDALSTLLVQSKFESRLLTAYLEGVSTGQSLDPAKNKNAQEMLTRLQKGARTPKEQKAAATLSLQKIKALKDYPAKGNLYRTLDDIPRSRIYSINSNFTVGERPAIDALHQKYGSDWAKTEAQQTGEYPANILFFNMRDKVGIKKTTALLKAAGIDAIEQNNERGKYVERAYIDQAPEILGINLEPVGPAKGLLFSRATPALDALADKIVAQPKTFKEKLGNNLALEAEMQGVDMRAGLRDVLKAGAKEMGDDTLFTQAMYNVLKADQKMPLIYTVMSNGPLETYRDDKGLIGVRSTNKNSAKDVYEAVAALPGKDAAQKDRLATAYMVAQRASNKGLEKLDVGALGVEQTDLDAVLAEAEADPELRKGLEAVRTAYNAYNKGLIDFLATTGAIPKAVAKKLNEAGDYVPFYRVNANGMADLVFSDDAMITIGDIRRQPYLAELKGGEQRILPLSEALPRNTILLTDKALTNMATKGVAYGLQSIGKGAGPVNPKTGKPTNKMPIQSGKGPADPRTIRFNQEPDPNDPKDTGERWLRVDTEGTLAEGVPSELLVKSLEGAHLPLPGFLKLAGKATDILRAGVTRTPLYLARQLIREPMAAAFTGGLNYNAFTAVLKGGMKFVQMTRGNTDAEAKLLEKGLIQSGIFTGDVDDMGKFALQLAGNNQSAMERLYAAADRAAIRADAATRSLVYENALANGLSEVEADFMTMESMNFYKRGLSPSVQYASRLIPFFNAQIQGLNVLYKAATGKMPFEEQQQIKRKFFNNAVLMMASGIVYAMAMEDDETWRNARPRDKMTNFFIPLPGTDELLKFPIPFEAGYFYSLAVAAVDGMREQTDNKEQWAAIKDLFINSIPGASSMGVPQIIKPIAEVWTNKNFMSGSEVESRRLQGLSTEERYNATTTELAKQMSKALPILSPIQIEHIVRGYLGVLPLAAAAAANGLFEGEGKGEKPEKRLSETALVGSAFQKKFGGADSDVVFRLAGDAMEARTTLNKMLNEGRREDAIAYREKNRVELQSASAAGQYRQLVGRINADLRRTQERTDLTAAEKRARIDKLDEAKQQAAQRFVTMVRRIEGAGA